MQICTACSAGDLVGKNGALNLSCRIGAYIGCISMICSRQYSVKSNNMPVCYPACDGSMVANTWHVTGKVRWMSRSYASMSSSDNEPTIRAYTAKLGSKV
jgi:hypothetical protein